MALLSVRDVASLLGVVEQTVYTHRTSGRLSPESENPLRFDSAHVHAAKLLSEADICGVARRGVARERLRGARMQGVVTPSEHGRYSLDDVKRVRAWVEPPPSAAAAGAVVGTGPAPAPAATPSPVVSGGVAPSLMRVTGSRAQMVEQYLVAGASPSDLPDDFWLTPRPPPFIPPRDVYREVVQGTLPCRDPEGGIETVWKVRIWRSGHFRLAGASVVWSDPGPRFEAHSSAPGDPVGKPPPASRLKNIAWRESRTEWLLAWESRSDLRARQRGRAGGNLVVTDGGHDLPGLLHEYHMFFDRPGDLPAEFWDGPEKPPFDPPTDALHYRWGNKKWLERGRRRDPVTEVIRGAGWRCVLMDDAGPTYADEDVETVLEGHNDDESALAGWNQAHDAAQREWDATWNKYLDYGRRFG